MNWRIAKQKLALDRVNNYFSYMSAAQSNQIYILFCMVLSMTFDDDDGNVRNCIRNVIDKCGNMAWSYMATDDVDCD